ncbi:MAG: tetratricopeptide repeat protein [Tepidisphaeraceae bacterium]
MDGTTAQEILAAANQHRQAGRIDEAIEVLKRGASRFPGEFSLHNELAILLASRGQFDLALGEFRQAGHCQPGQPQGRYNVGLCLMRLSRFAEAEGEFRETVRLAPGFADAHAELALSLGAQDRSEEELHAFAEAERLAPHNPRVLNNFASALARANKWDDATQKLERAVSLESRVADFQQNLGRCLANQGRIEEARRAYDRALELRADPGVLVRRATVLPVILESAEQIAAERRNFERGLAGLREASVALNDPVSQVGPPHFYLAYHGQDDRSLHEMAAQFHLRACPSLSFVAPHCRAGAIDAANRRIRIGFVSTFLRDHTIGKLNHGLIRALDRARFEVFVFQGGKHNSTAAAIAASADHAVPVGESLESTRQRIADATLDILFYTDIGMSALTYFLAFSRLAPVQCVTWGHPVTSGIPGVDYFISAHDLETDRSDAQYSERLVRLSSLGVCYERPRNDDVSGGRELLQVPGDAHAYFCPQSLFKFHPDFDRVIGEILRRDTRGRLVLIDGQSRWWRALLAARFSRSIPDVSDRIRFVGRFDQTSFMRALSAADAILDTPHFGGGNTSYEAFAVGAPIVTWPSEMLRGRITFACCRQMGVMDCVADTLEQYVEHALRLGTDTDWRRHVSGMVAANSQKLYENTGIVREMERFFESTLAAPAP